jgi:Zn-dependent protease with chaperone function
MRVFHEAVAKVGLRRVPRFYRFSDERPLVFTIGSFRPAIFAAPKIVEKLEQPELEATLLHELIHIKRRDNLLIWFLEILFVSIPILIVQVFALSFIYSVENSVLAILGSLVVLTIFKAVVWKRILYLRELSCDDFSVDKIKDPLILASSLVNVWRIGQELPKYRWQTGLQFTQTLLPPRMKLDNRINRLLNYRRPWLKLLLGRVMRWAVLVFLIFTIGFIWRFYAEYGHLDFAIKGLPDVHICGDLCAH